MIRTVKTLQEEEKVNKNTIILTVVIITGISSLFLLKDTEIEVMIMSYKNMIMEVTEVSCRDLLDEDEGAYGRDQGRLCVFAYSKRKGGPILGSTWTVAPKEGNQWEVQEGDLFAWLFNPRMSWLSHEVRWSPTLFLRGNIAESIIVDASYATDEIPL